jgi:hypothetical protein
MGNVLQARNFYNVLTICVIGLTIIIRLFNVPYLVDCPPVSKIQWTPLQKVKPLGVPPRPHWAGIQPIITGATLHTHREYVIINVE